MPLLKWDDSFSVGVEQIDKQHKELFELLNKFYDSFQSVSQAESSLQLIKGMNDYVKTHFAFEERYMKLYGYENTVLHLEEHRKFIEQASSLESRISSGKFVMNLEITNFLKGWITNHIKVEDKKYTKCFNNNGLK